MPEHLIAAHRATRGQVSQSPFGPDDQIGMLNLLTSESTRAVLARADGGHVIDLSVDVFVGMPTWTAGGEPPFQMWMEHTPRGSAVDDPIGVGRAQNEHVSWSADAMSMFVHSGTHIDTLNHFGYDGRIWNGFTADDHLGSKHWTIGGADAMPPIIARGVLIDVAAAHGVDVLPDSYAIGRGDLEAALDRQGVTVEVGDVVCVRTGRGSVWPDAARYLPLEPGLDLEGATFLAEAGAIAIGADNIASEVLPSPDPDNWMAVHTYLLAECGVPIIEVLELEELSRQRLYEFAFVGACMKIRGATGGPMRPLAMPLKENP
ncbi:cyclase family protein [Mycolicibacterium sp.]|uniref:cyclase family protein n=1 Tax=Mycolicibacterium sp. TaxID=2320850 RepID=UPI003D130B61